MYTVLVSILSLRSLTYLEDKDTSPQWYQELCAAWYGEVCPGPSVIYLKCAFKEVRFLVNNAPRCAVRVVVRVCKVHQLLRGIVGAQDTIPLWENVRDELRRTSG